MKPALVIVFTLFALFAVAACNAAPAQQAAPGQGISVEEAGVIVMRATATAGAMETQIAVATVTAEAYSYGVRQTEDAQRIQSTNVAIELLEANARATQAQLQTDEQQAAIDSEMAALEAQHQAELNLIEEKRKREEAERINVENANRRIAANEKWAIIGWAIVASVVCSVVIAVGYVLSVAIEKSLPRLARGWYGFQYPQLSPPDDNIVEGEATEAEPPKSRLRRWQEYIIDFCEFAERPKSEELNNTYPFSERRLDLVGVERDLWQETIGWLVTVGVLVRTTRAKNASAGWGGDWSLAELRRKIYLLALPFPPAKDPPRIDVSVLESAHAQ